MKRLTLIHLGAWLLLGLAAAGCYSPPPLKKPREVLRTDTNPEFAALREDLVDIVVLSARPPEGDPAAEGPHLRRFRRLVYQGLLDKGYSPLQLAYVDKQLAGEPEQQRFDPDANLNRFDEDAVMVLGLNEWDKRYLRDDGGILVSATLSLIRSNPKTKLWMNEIRHRIYKIPVAGGDVALTQDELVVDEVVKDLLQKLPPRA
jgi:hypothetical protein